ncbi:hypothetical protein K457DRAFT_894951 [Linnemannia elongata AG-77]|uniref:Uncharacterized protein n=1 Tax=Linnemannia elongata AG-77 TaxID=1314771 RepID=A0A197JVE5_9FUNG|nr:hypothetical protein K457DRAFT_894951 [Linnemannia elongata AG-77]
MFVNVGIAFPVPNCFPATTVFLSLPSCYLYERSIFYRDAYLPVQFLVYITKRLRKINLLEGRKKGKTNGKGKERKGRLRNREKGDDKSLKEEEATIGFVHADSSVGQGNNHVNNVQGQDSFLIGKDGPFDGSAVEEEGVEGGVGVRGVGIDSEPAGSIVLQPAAPEPATGPEQSVEEEDDLEGEVVGANREAMTGESTAESKKGMKKRPGTLNTHRNSKSKHRHHRGHGRGHLRGRYGKKKGVVHRDRNGQRPGGRDDKKQGDYVHRHGEYKVRKHGHKHHEKLRHHGAGHGQGGKKSPRVRNLVTRQLNLVCDGKIIDKVRCRRRSTSLPSHIHLEESPFPNPDNNNNKGDDEDFGGQLYALNTRKRIKQHYVFMSSPCSNALLPSRKNEAQGVLVRPLVSEASIDESLEYEAVDHVKEVDGEDDSDDDDVDDGEEDDDGDDYEDLDESAVDGRLEAKNNDGRNHPHHEQNPGNQQPQKRPYHPYKDLCIAKGHFCGSRMFGCRFRRTTLYDCQAVGAKPLVRLVDAKVCGGSRGDNSGGNGTDPQDPCKCAPGTSATTIIPICGSQLPARCNIEPNAIYFCPHGPGSKFELLQICQPGTQCRARSNGADPICGASTCDCTGSNQLCADQFPDNCPGISKNTAYKCSLNNGGKADMVKECASDQTCVSISGGTLCISNDCTCPVDGTACGEIFPLRCRIPTTALYSCRCTSPGTVSGGTFPNYCKLEPNTLYTCTTLGSPPIPGEKCIAPKSKPPTSSSCIINGGDDSNPGHTDGDKGKPLTCSCKSVGGGILAGADLAPECHADPTVIYYCPKDGDGSQGGGSDKDPPVVLQQCPPGTISQSRPRPLEPQCGFSNCNCTTAITGNVAVCSDQFPLSCKLIPNSVYKCSASGVPELVSTCSSSLACVPGQLNRAVCAGSGTSENGCKCTEDGSICGGAFPLSCGLSSTKVFNCKKGQAPIVHTDCCAGTTCLTTPSATLCVDSCACAVQGDVCGASFPPTCKLEASTIYKCTGAAANPIAGEKCAKGCTIQASADVCSHDGDGNEQNVCSCETVGVGNICGSDLPASCRAETNSIYICRDAKQVAPEVLSACHPGTLCKKRPFPAGAACSATSCNCTIDGEICSDNVRETCGLEPNTIYRCSLTGLLPTSVRKCDSSSTCVNYNDTIACVSNNCICSEEGEVCGDAFPLSCKLKGSTVYTCAKGQAPVAKHDCGPLRCSAVGPSTGDRCVDPCSCERNDVVCGSTFPSTCNLNKNILYKCTGPGFTPIPTTLCGEGKCVANAGPDTCDGPGAHVDPPPSEICTCPVSSSPVCGKVLASTFCRKVMDIDPNLVYHCPGGPGTLPEIQQICQPGTICISQPEPIGAACGGTTCSCTGVTELCARAFKERCGLRPNSVYRCSASGIPKLVQKCTSKQVCVTESDGSQCVSNDCKCEVDGFTCGERFHLSCGFKGTALYNCTKGESPIFIKDFAPDRCASYKIVREAEPEDLQAEAVPTRGGGGGGVPSQVSNYTAFDDVLSDIDYMDMSACHCTKELAMVCGQSFPERCGYDRNEVYRCDGPNQEPFKAKLCPGTDSCVVNPGDDDCSDCKCTGPGDVCGRKFPESCAYNPDQLFSCPGGIGSDTIPSERCVENGCAEEESGNCHCGPRDPCRCTDRRHICGSTFSDECHFDPEHLYVCSRRGSLPTKLEDCGFGCLKNYPAEADRCKTVPHEVVDCTCRDVTRVCGSAFPKGCNFDKEALFKCGFGKGSTPRFDEKCASGRCLVKEGADDVCMSDQCVCKDKKAVCGNSFPEECKLDADRIYSCPSSGATPIAGELCPEGCAAQNEPDSSDECKKPECTCQKAGTLCGRSMQSGCNFSNQSIYDCTAGVGSTPVLQKLCVPGTTCQENAEGASCCGSKCTCTGNLSVCSNQFPDGCGLQKNAVYKCTPSGRLVLDKDCEGDRSCVSVVSGATCTSTDCKCIEDGQVCGRKFPPSCKLNGSSLYTCHAGDSPVLDKDCSPGYCDVPVHHSSPSTIECIDPCVCPSVDMMCGSTFSDACKLDAGSLYSCTSIGIAPVLAEKCMNDHCMTSMGPDSCGPIVEPPSRCFCNSTASICGSSLDLSCESVLGEPVDASSVYTCSDDGQKPVKSTKCTMDEVCTEESNGAKCKSLCTCTGTDTKCSKDFPPACHLPEGVYKCGSDGKPQKDRDCLDLNICVDNVHDAFGLGLLHQGVLAVFRAEASDSCIDQCACKEANVPVCGSVFDSSCTYKTNDLMDCKNVGDVPTIKESCTALCTVQPGPDVCAFDPCACSTAAFEALAEDKCIDQCACKEANVPVCASTFDSSCSYGIKSLLACGNTGDVPTVKENCTLSCTPQSGPDACTLDPCACTKAGDVCSKSFPDSCPLDKDTFKADFRATADDICIDQCACKEAGVPICGGAFDSICAYDSKALMDCTNMADVPTVKENCTLSCDKKDGPDDCALDPCACTAAGDTCSNTFPSTCPYEKDSVYTCEGPRKLPTKKETCPSPQVCLVTPTGPTATAEDICIDHCACIEANVVVCASAFDPLCNYKAKDLMECTMAGDVPTVKESCTASCTVQPGPDICAFDPCACTKSGDICSQTFPDTCGYEPETVLSCSGNKALPTEKAPCKSGTSTLEFSAAADDNCIDQCACKEAGVPICASTFDPICHYDSKALMDCANTGDIPTVKETCTLSCTEQPGPDECKSDPCACTKVGDACGSTLPSNCGYEKDSVYTCSAIKALPICASAFDSVCNYKEKDLMACGQAGDIPTVTETCTLSCTKQPGPDVCALDPCACTKAEETCGSIFPTSCNDEANSLYTCSANKALPVKKAACPAGNVCLVTATGSDCGTGTCSANVVAGTAAFASMAEDKCIDQCACKEANVPVCASAFDTSCSYGNKSLMDCGNAGDVPNVKEECTLSCTKQPGPDVCTFDPCACTKAGDACGSTLPPNCGYEKDSIYTCSSVKALPVKKSGCTAAFRATADDKCLDQCACKEAGIPVCGFAFDATCNYDTKMLMSCGEAGDVPAVAENCTLSCTKQPGADICTFDPCACTKAGDTCGSAFPETCNYEKDSQYSCPGNKALPVKKAPCPTRTCSANVVAGTAAFSAMADDKCLDLCACKEANVPVCASAFDASCGYGNKSLMDCGDAGNVPTVKEACTLSCTKQPGPDVCTFDPCACTKAGDACGSSLPPNCGYEKDSVYTCSAIKALPGTSEFRATADDKCLGQCACKEANVPICASAFDSVCNYMEKDLMACGQAGDVPTVTETCTLSCTKQPGPDICALDPCACTMAGDTCGNTFPDICGYDMNARYSCAGERKLPVKKDTCPTGNVCVKTGTAVFTAMAASDICVDQCACKVAGVPICASTFDPICNYGNKSLMACGNVGDVPTVKDACTLSCTKQPGPDVCTFDPCACTKVGDACGGTLPPNCGYEKDSVYTCSAIKALPGTAAFRATADDKCLDQCACKEAGVPVCASAFDSTCNYNPKQLMDCGLAGDVPTVRDTCTLSCTKQPGADMCAFDPCACNKAGNFCGSNLPAGCGYEAGTLYTCVPTATPVIAKNCLPGICSTNTTAASSGANGVDICIPLCACKEPGAIICASEFDASCPYDKKALLECGSIADVPKVKETCTLKCDTTPDPDECAPDVCACSKAGDTCGSAFPDTCNYENNSQYTCSANKALPVKKAACPGSQVCASVFDPSCNYGNKSLMDCGNAGDVPTVKEACTLSCTKQLGPDVCTVDPCACTTLGDMCGSSLPLGCSYESESIYTCSAIKALPVKKSACQDDYLCFKTPEALLTCGDLGNVPTIQENCTASCEVKIGSDACALDPCACTKSGDTCGSAFPDTCNYEKNSQYTCSGNKALPVKKIACPASNVCLVTATESGTSVDFSAMADDICIDQCACKEAGVAVCGSVFSSTCAYNTKALMNCANVGDVPTVKETCTLSCTVQAGPDVCTFDPCACTTIGDTCGGSLPANCSYNPTVVYSCAVPAVKKDCGDGTCSSNINSGKAEFMAAGDDFCVDKCACQVANVPVCASSFSADCKYDNKTLMSCGNQGDVPVVSDTCTSYCNVIPSAPDVCAFDPCACQRVGDTCGKSFPANCGYLPNSLYTCATNRALPVKKSDCQSSEICQIVPGGVDVCVANKVCDCVGTGTVCTDQFPADCAKPANSVVTCPAGTITACPNGCAIGACQDAGCTCTDTNVRCGASFAPSCNLIPSALYTCVSGQAPVLKVDCGAQACVLSGLNAVCQDPCKCRSIAATCGSAFPTSCGLSSGTLYNCTAVGETPVLASVVYAPLIATLNEVSANLAASKDDLTSLANIAAPAGATVASALQLLTTAQVDFRTLNFMTSVALNSSIPDLQTLIQKVVSCANSNTADCTGILTMYRRVAAAANIKATQTPAPVTADMKSQLAAITTALEKTLTTGDTSTLRATGQTFGALIGKTAGNTVNYGDFSNSLLYMYEAFGEALKCQGVNIALFADKCTMYRDRLSGVLGDFIQFIQDNIGSFPVVGPLIITPLLAALKSLVIDLQTGIATAIGGTVALLYGILQMVNIVSPANQTNPIRDYLLRLVGLLDIPTECGGGGSNCTGLIQIVRMIANALLVQMAGIPVAGYLIASTLNPLIDGLFQALTSGTSAVIYASYTALNAALTTLAFVPYFGTISTPLQYMVNAIKQIADCLSTGSSTSSGATTVDKLELESGGVEKVELLGGDNQEQQPFMMEQFERILSEV